MVALRHRRGAWITRLRDGRDGWFGLVPCLVDLLRVGGGKFQNVLSNREPTLGTGRSLRGDLDATFGTPDQGHAEIFRRVDVGCTEVRDEFPVASWFGRQLRRASLVR